MKAIPMKAISDSLHPSVQICCQNLSLNYIKVKYTLYNTCFTKQSYNCMGIYPGLQFSHKLDICCSANIAFES